MKKIIIMLLSVSILLSSIVVNGKNPVEAKADVEQGPYQQSYMSQYFYNLNTNFPVNMMGTCGYVAISMLLSYYDNYLHKDIIPEPYEATVSSTSNNFMGYNLSPGVKRINVDYEDEDTAPDIYIPNNSTPEQYYTEMLEHTDSNFQARLFQSARTGWIKTIFDSYDEDYGSLLWGDILMLTRWRLEDAGFIYNGIAENGLQVGEFTIDLIREWEYGWTERNRLTKQFTKEKILQGYPVLLFIQSTPSDNAGAGKTGHFVIAYDYDPITDKIFCHSGWDSDQHSTVEELNYQYWNAAMTLDINTPHVCDNNYVYNNVGYCFHDEEIITYEHTHVYNDEETFWVTSPTDGYTYVRCQSCPETIRHSHSYVYSPFKNNTHKATCSCGWSSIEMHVARSTDLTKCILCNATITSDSLIVWSISPSKYSLNGSYIRNDGVVVLVDEDIQAYLDGTLIFYSEDYEIL